MAASCRASARRCSNTRSTITTSGQLLSGSFMDYAMPRAGDLPSFAFSTHNVPTKANPLGVKGAGEAGAVGAPPAVINAVVDALHIAPECATSTCRRRHPGCGRCSIEARPEPFVSPHIPSHPFAKVLHRVLQLELRLEAEMALGPAQIAGRISVAKYF